MRKLLDINDSPLLPVLSFYITGILCGNFITDGFIIFILFITGLLICLLYFLPYRPSVKFTYSRYYNYGLYLTAFSLALLNVCLTDKRDNRSADIEEGRYMLILDTDISETKTTASGKYYKTDSKCVYLKAAESHEPKKKINLRSDEIHVKGDLKIISYFPVAMTDSIVSKTFDGISAEDSHYTLSGRCGIMTIGELRRIKNKGNPFEFDYASFMKIRGTEYCFYADTFRIIKPLEENRFVSFSHYLRKRIEKAIDNMSLDTESAALIKAITTGRKDDIEKEQRESFSASGLSHILAVSGMHTGIIFLIVTWLLFPVMLFKGRIIRLLISAFVIILFCFITGLSPSVIRASSMILIIIAGRIFFQKNNTLNCLVITAFIMLLYNPYYIYDAGFQLSFLAVLSILIYYPVFEKLYYEKHTNKKESERVTFFTAILPEKLRWLALKMEKGKMKIFSLINISVSAQILTLPVSIYYFNIFPLSFILTNLLVIPLLFPLILLITCSVIINIITGGEFIMLTLMINKTAMFINDTALFFSGTLSFMSIRNIYPDMTEVIIIYAIIIWASVYLINRKAHNLIMTLIMTLIFFGYQYYEDLRPEIELYIPNNYYNTTIHYIGDKENRRNEFIITCDSVADISRLNYITAGFNKKNNVKISELINSDEYYDNNLIKKDFLMQAGDKSFCFVDGALNNKTAENKLRIDYPVICRGYKGSVKQLNELFDYSEIIVSSSVSEYYKSRIKNDADSLNIPVYDISERGAFIIYRK